MAVHAYLRPVMGRLDRAASEVRAVLAGLSYPAQKWRIVARCGVDTSTGRSQCDPRVAARLWALPHRAYRDLADVLAAMTRGRHAR